jgi:branched-subunit amino acid aminotransferase/4-amino-4-deoxychorismate lyase
MTVPLAYLSGKLVPHREASLPIADAGLVFGATVTDFCRTFHHKLFRWPEHLARFRRDCAACFIPLFLSDIELTRHANDLVAHNAGLLSGEEELALVTFATPGSLGLYAGTPSVDGSPTLVMHTVPLSRARYQHFFTEGVALALGGHHGAHPDDLAPPRFKHRSRLHWWRANHLLRQRTDVPERAIPVLLDGPDGPLTETAIGNLLAVLDGVVTTPPRGTVLDSISVKVVEELCDLLTIPFHERRLTLGEVQSASEIMLTGTAFCLAGVRWLEGIEIPCPGPITRALLGEWSRMVNMDIVGQFCQP